jgi:hypothetical protein
MPARGPQSPREPSVCSGEVHVKLLTVTHQVVCLVQATQREWRRSWSLLTMMSFSSRSSPVVIDLS